MDHRETFYATIERRPVPRPCTWLGIPDAQALPGLFQYFGVTSPAGLIEALDDDIAPVELPYHSPNADAIYAALDFAERGKIDREHRTLNAPGFFRNHSDPAAVEEFEWPDPSLYIDPEECRRTVAAVPAGRAVLGVLWSAHFQDLCAAFGLETAFLKFYDAPDLVDAISERIVSFYLKANEIFYDATRGQLDAVLIGNDYGAQRGLMLSPEQIRRFALPGATRLVNQAKSYGVKVIYHSCGSIRDIIPDLIRLGVDAIHPIQALAAGMEATALQRDFGEQVSFCGGVDHQALLMKGTPEDVKRAVRKLRELFPTGLIISPSHEAILPEIPPANLEALLQAARED
jgi:uroporphyrinogen decarboxylase